MDEAGVVKNCGTCRFFHRFSDIPMGECRRECPLTDMMPIYDDSRSVEESENEDEYGFLHTAVTISMDQVDVTRRGIWPQVAVDDWCGRWKKER